jgi:hypothetical protein
MLENSYGALFEIKGDIGEFGVVRLGAYKEVGV